MMDLPRHRPKTAHLPHQPFIYRDALRERFGQEFSGLLAEIEQDRAGFEHADAIAIGTVRIDDRGDLVVRTDRQEFGCHLLDLGDVDREYLVRQPHFLQRDTDLAAVRRVPGVQFDGHFSHTPSPGPVFDWPDDKTPAGYPVTRNASALQCPSRNMGPAVDGATS